MSSPVQSPLEQLQTALESYLATEEARLVADLVAAGSPEQRALELAGNLKASRRSDVLAALQGNVWTIDDLEEMGVANKVT